MTTVGRTFGYLMLLGGAALGAAQLVSYVVEGVPGGWTVGALWIVVHADSLSALQHLLGMDGALGPAAWDPFQWLLSTPAWAALVVPGSALVFFQRGCEASAD
jgi:hypothetical protein